MKVLVCIPCLLTGGTEIQTFSLAEALVAAGHRVTVVCYFEWDGQMVERFRKVGAEVRLLSPDGSRSEGIRAVSRHLWKGLRQIVREIRPEIAHVQYMAPGAIPIIILRALGIRKIVATAHTGGDIYSRNGLRIIRWLTKNLLSGFQCITERAERSIFGSSSLFDGRPLKHFTIYNNLPAHISILGKPRSFRDPENTLTVGVVSRIEHIKGMDLVVPAFAEAYKQNPRLRLLVAGDGSQRELMERQAAESGLPDRVTFLGRQPQDKLQDIYDRIDILLMPSRSEGFGLTAIEGMARGCVPVVADTGGLPEVVTDGRTGLLHKPGDISDIASKINFIAGSARLEAMSSAAIERAGRFNRARYFEAIVRLYDNLSGNGKQ